MTESFKASLNIPLGSFCRICGQAMRARSIEGALRVSKAHMAKKHNFGSIISAVEMQS